MKEQNIRELFKLLERDVQPPESMKRSIFANLEANRKSLHTSVFERFLFEKPIQAACLISLPLSSILYLFAGNTYTSLLTSFLSR